MMETLSAPTKKETILMALTKVPIATTQQLAKLFNNGSPLKRASERLQELEKDKLVEWEWHKRAKLWRLTRKGLSMQNGSRMNCSHVDHALAVGEIYFTLKPFQWLYEPVEKFEHIGKGYVWNPDVLFAYVTPEGKKKLYCAEVQRTPLSAKQWSEKWMVYNLFFQEAYKSAAFQEWRSGNDPIAPSFVCVTSQKKTSEGFDIPLTPKRELKIISSIADL